MLCIGKGLGGEFCQKSFAISDAAHDKKCQSSAKTNPRKTNDKTLAGLGFLTRFKREIKLAFISLHRFAVR